MNVRHHIPSYSNIKVCTITIKITMNNHKPRVTSKPLVCLIYFDYFMEIFS